MTENEALNTLHILLAHEKTIDAGKIISPNNLHSQEKEALQFILEEIQQYRAIGTIEEFKALKEKNTPKKPIIEYHCGLEIICPTCNCKVNDIEDKEWRCKCGQKLDWKCGE